MSVLRRSTRLAAKSRVDHKVVAAEPVTVAAPAPKPATTANDTEIIQHIRSYMIVCETIKGKINKAVVVYGMMNYLLTVRDFVLKHAAFKHTIYDKTIEFIAVVEKIPASDCKQKEEILESLHAVNKMCTPCETPQQQTRQSARLAKKPRFDFSVYADDYEDTDDSSDYEPTA
jgi:hypothetical protein